LGSRSLDPPSRWLPQPYSENFSSGMARNMVLLREPRTQPPSICRPAPQVPGNLERRANSTRAPPCCYPNEQGQPFEAKRTNGSLRGRTLAGPPSPPTKETDPSGLGVLWTPRPDSGDKGKYNSRASSEASRRDILRHFQLANQQPGALLPYWG
jgi:hypothetical protein